LKGDTSLGFFNLSGISISVFPFYKYPAFLTLFLQGSGGYFFLLLDLLQGSAILFRPMQNFIPLSFIGSSHRFASLEERTKVENL